MKINPTLKFARITMPYYIVIYFRNIDFIRHRTIVPVDLDLTALQYRDEY
jgi:hypothetical protein|tara:strand:+ start:979 stop:1128 length:150 start_codon:yes stop_codon:yes gene_type:complete